MGWSPVSFREMSGGPYYNVGALIKNSCEFLFYQNVTLACYYTILQAKTSTEKFCMPLRSGCAATKLQYQTI
jgi:hypothetical protein